IGPDEPRYAAIAAAMARTQDWITPRLWGAAWFEKPVLYYWLAGLSQCARGRAGRVPGPDLGVHLWLRTRGHHRHDPGRAADAGVDGALSLARERRSAVPALVRGGAGAGDARQGPRGRGAGGHGAGRVGGVQERLAGLPPGAEDWAHRHIPGDCRALVYRGRGQEPAVLQDLFLAAQSRAFCHQPLRAPAALLVLSAGAAAG